MKREATAIILAVAFGALFLALGASASAQQPKIVPRVGYVSPVGDPKTPGPQIEGFRQGLRDLGYIEGKNIVVEYRYTEGKGDRNPSLVAELMQLKVDVLVVTGPGSIRAAKQSTKTIPIVMVAQRIQSRLGISIAWHVRAGISQGSPDSPES